MGKKRAAGPLIALLLGALGAAASAAQTRADWDAADPVPQFRRRLAEEAPAVAAPRDTALKSAAVDEDDAFVTPGTGSWVMDREDRVGRVVEAFSNGAVRYRVGNAFYVSNALSEEIGYGDGVWTGDAVIDPDNDIGTVVRIFAGGRIQYRVRGALYVAKGGLRREVDEYPVFHGRTLSRGSSIVTAEGRPFTVERVFSDARVTVRADGKTMVLDRTRYTLVRGKGER
ncbi:MAG: hypothetical protein HY925_02795 [Elusimicrobia bacterium]|nr:hypothetical protein [Elusimicrobiota bacterium]